MSLKLNTASGGSITLQEADTASNLTLTVPAQSATLATLTTPSFATTIGVGGATPSASGAGITFPSTQSASSDANTLDDYEEGTWTPTMSSGTATIKSAVGTYTKIGNRVIVSFNFTGNSTGTSSSIGGLPFTVSEVTNGGAREIENTGFLWSAQANTSSTTFNFRRYDNNSTLTANDIYVGMIVYRT
jgi:hypothetical protein